MTGEALRFIHWLHDHGVRLQQWDEHVGEWRVADPTELLRRFRREKRRAVKT